MEINLSNETIYTVYNALRSSKQSLNRQLKASLTKVESNAAKVGVLAQQLEDVENALFVFEELVDRL